MDAKNDGYICGIKYKIEEKAGLGLDGCFGLCDNNRETIHFEPSQKCDQLFRTLIHELLHAIIHQTSLELPNEELAVSQLTNGTYSILTDPRNELLISQLASILNNCQDCKSD